MMRSKPYGLLLAAIMLSLAGCGSCKPEYGFEAQLALPGNVRQTWAIAPAVNLSGQKQVDPILQADILYGQLQSVAGLNVIPVNRVVEVLLALHLDQIQSEGQAALVCDLLGADALVVPTVSAYDPYEPPKLAASLQLFRKGAYRRPVGVDPRELARLAAPATMPALPVRSNFLQVVGMFDAANGSIREEVIRYAAGRHDPEGPYQARLYVIEMDRYCGFVYFSLIRELLAKPALNGVSGTGPQVVLGVANG